MANKILFPVPTPPVVENKTIEYNEVACIVFKNAGTAKVLLWNGMYTLVAGEALTLNVTEHHGTLNTKVVDVTFDTSTGAEKRLEILRLSTEFC